MATAVPKKLSPGRQQYLDLKKRYGDAILLFRIGDFYETFDEDAKTMAKVLQIALTSRDVGGGQRAPLAGIPHHALDVYLGRLVRQGLRVAIAEQMGDPAAAPGVVDRDVVRVVTPGTIQDSDLLQSEHGNYLVAAVCAGEAAGVASIDLTTAHFTTAQMAPSQVLDEITKLGPAELLVDDAAERLVGELETPRRAIAADGLDAARARDELCGHFGVESLATLGCEELELATIAAAAVLRFAKETQTSALQRIGRLRTVLAGDYMQMDRHTIRNLDLLQSANPDAAGPTLFSTLNHNSTPLGVRLLRRWITHPLTDVAAIRARQAAVRQLVGGADALSRMAATIKGFGDLERTVSRVGSYAVKPRDVVNLANSLRLIPDLRRQAEAIGGAVGERSANFTPFEEAVHLIDSALVDDPPAALGGGASFKSGYSAELDELRGLTTTAHTQLLELEKREREQTGINTLKTGSTKVFGYYIEVSRTHLAKVPDRFERKQTLAGAERFTTPELRRLEERILGSRERIDELERNLFEQLCGELLRFTAPVLAFAEHLAELDVLCALALCALRKGWVEPVVDEGDRIAVGDGRHPMVEEVLAAGEFVPNDVSLSREGDRVAIITGPNMSGKSCYIRMVALLTLLAQMGSFIPAKSARIGVVDQIFTRTGLSDDITGGRSTFMVEMVETATILAQATPKSLVVLDEIGRGTSTYDGLAIAQAVAEHLHDDPRLGCRTLFATHYHEMGELAERLEHVRNYRVEVVERDGRVHFLRKIVPGNADRSFGVYVAKLAGMPPPVVKRASDLLAELEREAVAAPDQTTDPPLAGQMSLLG